MGKVVVIGSSNTDMVVRSKKIPLPGETLLGGDFDVIAGGKGANQAVAAARSDANVSFIAKVGNDNFGEKAIQAYKNDNIDTSNIFVDSDKPSGIAIIIVDETTGQNSIVVAPGANGNLQPKDIDKVSDIIASADVVLMQLEIPLESVKQALSIAKKNGITTIMNPAPAQELSNDMLKLVDIITPNESETNSLIGFVPESDEDIIKATEILLEKVNDTALITLGSRGVYYKSKNGNGDFIPSIKVNAVDTTGAGDVFNGYFASLIANGETYEKAIQIANKAAAISVTRKGAQPSIPTFTDVKDL